MYAEVTKTELNMSLTPNRMSSGEILCMHAYGLRYRHTLLALIFECSKCKLTQVEMIY